MCLTVTMLQLPLLYIVTRQAAFELEGYLSIPL